MQTEARESAGNQRALGALSPLHSCNHTLTGESPLSSPRCSENERKTCDGCEARGEHGWDCSFSVHMSHSPRHAKLPSQPWGLPIQQRGALVTPLPVLHLQEKKNHENLFEGRLKSDPKFFIPALMPCQGSQEECSTLQS